MNNNYIDEIIFRAVSLEDVELLVFVLSRLSKCGDEDVLKNLANVIYKDNKNVYEYLLVHRKNEMLNTFIKFGFWAHVHIPINKYNETMLEYAYRINNLSIVISLLGHDNSGYNKDSEDLNKILNNIKSDYQTSSFLLDYINKKVMFIEYPEELTEDKINKNNYEYSQKINCEISETEADNFTLEDSTIEYERTIMDEDVSHLGVIFNNFSQKMKKVFGRFFSKKKDDHIKEENELASDSSTLIILNDVPSPKEIKEKIDKNNEITLNTDLKNMIKDITIVQKKSNDSVKKLNFDKSDTIERKRKLGLLKDLSSYKLDTKKEQVSFILKDVIDALSTNDLNIYSTIKNFISVMNDYNIKVLPKIESLSISSFEFIFEDSSFSLSSLESVSMKELRDVLCINSEDNIFLIGEKINYLEVNNKKGNEYLRLVITKTYLESQNLRDFINRLKDNSIDIETSIKDFSIITTTEEELKNLEDILTIYKYKKDNVIIDDEDLPEPVRYCEIRDSFKNK